MKRSKIRAAKPKKASAAKSRQGRCKAAVASRPNLKIQLLDVPQELRQLIPEVSETEHKLYFLEIDGTSPALVGLLDILSKDKADLEKLMRNVRLQLGLRSAIRAEAKARWGGRESQRKILEIKATRGSSRLFVFFSEPGRMIVATNTYWKASNNKTKQNHAFDTAAKLREMYLSEHTKRSKAK